MKYGGEPSYVQPLPCLDSILVSAIRILLYYRFNICLTIPTPFDVLLKPRCYCLDLPSVGRRGKMEFGGS